jgi:uncharacterized protein YbjQ (UPF0145 family)
METSVNRIQTSTTFDLPGHRVLQVFGLVRGIVCRSRSVFGTMAGSLQTIFGGNITMFTQLCEKTRGEAFDIMLRNAELLHANAVIGIKYDSTEVMQGVTEVLVYGTAVRVEPE